MLSFAKSKPVVVLAAADTPGLAVAKPGHEYFAGVGSSAHIGMTGATVKSRVSVVMRHHLFRPR